MSLEVAGDVTSSNLGLGPGPKPRGSARDFTSLKTDRRPSSGQAKVKKLDLQNCRATLALNELASHWQHRLHHSDAYEPAF